MLRSCNDFAGMSAENMEQNVDEIPWPKAGDNLFQSGDDWWNNASLEHATYGWELYASGYKEAADCLAEHVAETGRRANLFVYPIAFLYRHYLELRLKELIIAGQDLLERDPDLRHVHRLDLLWTTCRSILEEVWSNSSRDPLNAVEECIKQFVQIDPESISFRYPANKDGKPTLPQLNHINIRNLKEVMNRVAALLEAAITGISVYIDSRNSMQADYYR